MHAALNNATPAQTQSLLAAATTWPADQARAVLAVMPPMTIAQFLADWELDEGRALVLAALDPEKRASVLETALSLESHEAVRILRALPLGEVAHLLAGTTPRRAAELLEWIPNSADLVVKAIVRNGPPSVDEILHAAAQLPASRAARIFRALAPAQVARVLAETAPRRAAEMLTWMPASAEAILAVIAAGGPAGAAKVLAILHAALALMPSQTAEIYAGAPPAQVAEVLIEEPPARAAEILTWMTQALAPVVDAMAKRAPARLHGVIEAAVMLQSDWAATILAQLPNDQARTLLASTRVPAQRAASILKAVNDRDPAPRETASV